MGTGVPLRIERSGSKPGWPACVGAFLESEAPQLEASLLFPSLSGSKELRPYTWNLKAQGILNVHTTFNHVQAMTSPLSQVPFLGGTSQEQEDRKCEMEILHCANNVLYFGQNLWDGIPKAPSAPLQLVIGQFPTHLLIYVPRGAEWFWPPSVPSCLSLLPSVW